LHFHGMHGLLSFAAAVVLTAVSVLLLVPVAVFFLQVFAARLPRREPHAPQIKDSAANSADCGASVTRLAVLVPAHDEAAGISATLSSIRSQLKPTDRLLVVADNCTDATADIARRCGAEVVERQQADLRGKGYALDFGLRHLAADPPSVLVIVDADCTLGEDCLRHLAEACVDRGHPVQALYLMNAPTEAPLRLRLAAFTWRIKNWLRPLGALRLGAPCPLMGTGMAFPWQLISQANLASGHLVEDMKLGIDLARAGHSPLFVPGARVDSVFPLSNDAAQAQRSRWEHGHLSTLLSAGPGLLWSAVSARDARLALMALDLMVPPLTLLLGLVLLDFLLGSVLASAIGVWPMGIALTGLILVLAASLRAWWMVGRDLLSIGDLLRAPAHIVVKVPMYLKFVSRRQKEWVRTERHDDKS
jgi:cellulose synthase/poly-beta-1,6-N-acetylglucosamine synthase-like glycosyltransferase